MGLSKQPRADDGRFGEKIEVGVQRRLTEALRRALGHDGTDGTGEPAGDDLSSRLDEQLDVAEDLDLAADLTLLADAPADVSELMLVGKTAARPAPATPVITFTGPAGEAFSDAAGLLWTHATGDGYPTLIGREDDVTAYDRFVEFIDRHGLQEPDGDRQEAPVSVTDDLDARLAAQEKALLEESPEAKVRKFDENLHPRDFRGRFATIGSTVSLPDSAGGGEGRVVAATGSNHVRVRKADGTEIDVDAKDTEVTASAAANAAHDSFERAGQHGGFSRAGQDAAVGTPAADAPAVAKPRAAAPSGKPKDTPAAAPAAPATPAAKPAKPAAPAKPKGGLTPPPTDHAAVEPDAVRKATQDLARQFAKIQRDSTGDRAGDAAVAAEAMRTLSKPDKGNAHHDAQQALRDVLTAAKNDDNNDMVPLLENASGWADVVLSPEQQGARAAHADTAKPKPYSRPEDLPPAGNSPYDGGKHPDQLDKERPGWDLPDEDLASILDDGMELDGKPLTPARRLALEAESQRRKAEDVAPTGEARGQTGSVLHPVTPGSEEDVSAKLTPDRIAAFAAVAEKHGMTAREAHDAVTGVDNGTVDNEVYQAWTDLVGWDHENAPDEVYKQVTDALDAQGKDKPVGTGGKVPQGGEWGEAPGENLDDGIDRSTWLGGQPPAGFDGTGTRPDGSAWGSGFPEGDPRQDPAYDQYTADMDGRIRAALEKYGETEALLDKVDGAPNAYQPERHAAHDAIIDELMAGYAGIPRENRAVIMAGPPGAGKSTVIKTNGSDFGVESDERGNPTNFAVVNPDDMKEELAKRGLIPSEYDEFGLAPGEMASFVHEESSWLAERLLTRLKADGVNLILDGTFAGKPDKQIGKVHGLREDGYSVRGVLVDGTVSRSLTNAGFRHKRVPPEPGGRYQGRYVPMSLIASNNPSTDQDSAIFGRPHRNKSSENIERAQDAFDEGVAWYDNSTGESKKVHDTFPTGDDAVARRMTALMTRINAVSDTNVRAGLQREYDALSSSMTTGAGKGWLDEGADLEAKVLDALVEQKAEGGADRNRGGAEHLRRYWVRGEGAAKIGWGTDGDFMRCVTLVSEHMDPERAKGYCNLRHQDAVGKPPGQGHKWLGKVERKEQPAAVPTHDNAAGENTLPNENPKPDGVMVALYPADDIVSALALDGGEAAADLHVTLAYLGKVDELGDPQSLIDAIAQLAARSSDVEAVVAGLGRWDAGEDGDAFVALVDSPELGPLRAEVVEACETAGHPPRDDHGFTAHITLAYLGAQDPTPVERIDALPATFQFLSLAIGEDVYDFPLAGADDAGATTDEQASAQGEGDAPYDAPATGTTPPRV